MRHALGQLLTINAAHCENESGVFGGERAAKPISVKIVICFISFETFLGACSRVALSILKYLLQFVHGAEHYTAQIHRAHLTFKNINEVCQANYQLADCLLRVLHQVNCSCSHTTKQKHNEDSNTRSRGRRTTGKQLMGHTKQSKIVCSCGFERNVTSVHVEHISSGFNGK